MAKTTVSTRILNHTLVSVVFAIGLLFVVPFAYILWRNIQLGSDFGAVLTAQTTLAPLARSLLLGVAVAASASVIGTSLAWATVRTDIPGRSIWRLLAPVPLVFPSFVGATALRAGLSKGGLVSDLAATIGISELPTMRGFDGAWLVLTLFTYPYVYLPVAARLATIPRSIEDSAQLLGRGHFETFWSVTCPQLIGSLSAGALLVFLYTISDFGAVALMGYDTLTEQIYADALFDQRRAMTLALILAATALAVVAAEQSIERRRARSEVVSDRPPAITPLGRWRWPVVVLVAAFLGNALIGPLSVLSVWAMRGIFADVDSIGLAVDVSGLAGPLARTATAGLATAAIAIVVVLPVAWSSVRRRSRLADVSAVLMVAGFALPGLVIALALVFGVLETPFLGGLYQTLPMLIGAYVLHFGAQATKASQVAVTAIPGNVSDAARALGAGRLRRLVQIDVPLMTPSLLAGAGLVLLSTMKELPATLLLAPAEFDTLATEIWGATEVGSWAQAAVASLLLVALSAVLTWVSVIRHANKSERSPATIASRSKA